MALAQAALLELNVAVTERAAVIDTVHVPVPVHAPLQPANVEPDAGVALKVTTVPLLKEAEQVLPQLIPAGLLVTVPFAEEFLITLTASVTCGGGVVEPGVVPQTSGEYGEFPAPLNALIR